MRFCMVMSLCVFLFVTLVVIPAVDAKTKKLDDESLSIAKELTKDRENAFSGAEAMPLNKFQEGWKALAERLDELYAGHKVRMNKHGSHVRFRMGFSHLVYIGLKVHTRVTPLEPSPAELVAGHLFLQELALEGSFYPSGDRYPREMKDLLQAEPKMASVLRANLDEWSEKYRREFERAFPIQAAKKME